MQLYNDSVLIVNSSNIPIKFKENCYLEYNDNNYNNYIDLENKIFIRENNEYKITISFNNKKIRVFLKNDNKEFESEIEGNINIDKNDIHIKYRLDMLIELHVQIL